MRRHLILYTKQFTIKLFSFRQRLFTKSIRSRSYVHRSYVVTWLLWMGQWGSLSTLRGNYIRNGGHPSFIHILCRFDSPQTGYFLAGFGGIWLACLLCWVCWAISLCFWFDWLGLWVIVTQQPGRLDPSKNFSKRVEELQKDPTQDIAY